MALDFSASVIKYAMCGFNFLFVLSGIVIIAVGATVQAAYYTYDEFLDHGFYATPALFITTGAIILIISFFGCCGAYKENYCMTVTFIVFLVFIFILELSAGIAGYMLRNRAYEALNTSLTESLSKYNSANETHQLWDNIQTDLSCCGAKNASDYQTLGIFNNDSVPLSCCSSVPLKATTCSISSKELHKQGCVSSISAVIQNSAGVLGGVAIFLSVIQLIGVLCASYLAKSIRSQYETV